MRRDDVTPLCAACESCNWCLKNGCIPLVTEDGSVNTESAWFKWLGACLACIVFALVLALSAGWLK